MISGAASSDSADETHGAHRGGHWNNGAAAGGHQLVPPGSYEASSSDLVPPPHREEQYRYFVSDERGQQRRFLEEDPALASSSLSDSDRDGGGNRREQQRFEQRGKYLGGVNFSSSQNHDENCNNISPRAAHMNTTSSSSYQPRRVTGSTGRQLIDRYHDTEGMTNQNLGNSTKNNLGSGGGGGAACPPPQQHQKNPPMFLPPGVAATYSSNKVENNNGSRGEENTHPQMSSLPTSLPAPAVPDLPVPSGPPPGTATGSNVNNSNVHLGGPSISSPDDVVGEEKYRGSPGMPPPLPPPPPPAAFLVGKQNNTPSGVSGNPAKSSKTRRSGECEPTVNDLVQIAARGSPNSPRGVGGGENSHLVSPTTRVDDVENAASNNQAGGNAGASSGSLSHAEMQQQQEATGILGKLYFILHLKYLILD